MKPQTLQPQGFQQKQPESQADRHKRLCKRVAAQKYNNYINLIHAEIEAGVPISEFLTQQAFIGTALQFLFARHGCGKKITTPDGKTRWVWNERKINRLIRREHNVLCGTVAVQTVIKEHYANPENKKKRQEREDGYYSESWHPPLKPDARKYHSGYKHKHEAYQGRPKILESRQRLVDMGFIEGVESLSFNSGSRFPARLNNIKVADLLLYCQAIEKVLLDLAETRGEVCSYNNFAALPVHKWFGLVKLFNILFKDVAIWRREDQEWEATLPIWELSAEEEAAWDYRFGWELSW